jgi:hypothetical protein
MRRLYNVSLKTTVTLFALPAAVGCGGLDNLYGDNPGPNTPPVILAALETCNNNATACCENADSRAAANACADDFQACQETALQPVAQMISDIRECNDTARQCTAATSDAGREAARAARDACLDAKGECIEAALPPPPPCIQSLKECLSSDASAPRQCFETAIQCLDTALRPRRDGGT